MKSNRLDCLDPAENRLPMFGDAKNIFDDVVGGPDQEYASETKPDSAHAGSQPSLLYQH